MLSKQQFLDKHQTRYASLTPAQREIRYQDYVKAYKLNNRKKAGPRPARRAAAYVKPPAYGNVKQMYNNKIAPYLSPCARDYLKALVNPFGIMNGQYPCIPDIISIPSYKFSTRIRTSMFIGSQGDGWVAVRPFVPVNDAINAQVTVPGYIVAGYNPTAAGVQNLSNDSPFTSADVKGMEFRVVGCGVKVTFSGSEFNKGGSVILHRAPTNETIPVPSTASDLLRTRTTTQGPAKREYEIVCYRPSDPKQLGYEPFDGALAPAINQTLLIYMTGATAAQSWYVEIITFWESIGNRQNPTPSHADPNGMAAINSALAQVGVSNLAPEIQLKAMESKAKEELAHQSGILNFLADGATAVASLAADFIGGPAAGMAVEMGINGLRHIVNAVGPGDNVARSSRGDQLRIEAPPIRVDEID